MKKQFGHTLRVRNVNEALPLGLQLMVVAGEPTSSRGLEVFRVPGPVTTIYERPEERVLFDQHRDANPFFHLMDALWMLSGSNRVEMPRRYLDRIQQFSDDGETFHGAYGYRLRHSFGIDQIMRAVDMLITKPDSRQIVLSIWDPQLDLGKTTKDMPCNDLIMLDVVNGRLNMTVCNRSNDVIWGAYGANAVQFSILQEVMATMAGLERGFYVQQSNNYHVYSDNAFWLKFLEGQHDSGHVSDPYSVGAVHAVPMAKDADDARKLMRDCEALDACLRTQPYPDSVAFQSTFFLHVVIPAMAAYDHYKSGQFETALYWTSAVRAQDWSTAMQQWITRRAQKAVKA